MIFDAVVFVTGFGARICALRGNRLSFPAAFEGTLWIFRFQRFPVRYTIPLSCYRLSDDPGYDSPSCSWWTGTL